MKYTPLKEASASNTIDRLLTIFENFGLDISVYDISKNKKGNIFSCVVRIDNTIFASNGKGATLQYSYASGLAELMERVENLTFEGSLFMDEPDVKKIPVEAFINGDNDLVGEKFFRLYTRDDDKIDYNIPYSGILNEIQRVYGNTNTINCLQYYDINNEKVVFLPTICKKTSNGMAAGNTPEEALVQGFSELFERYVQDIIFCRGIVFPIIPESEYNQYDKLTKIINQYEKLGFKIQVRDASLGKNFPVICVVMFDSKTSKYNVHFGAHPVLPIAIERTLTEVAQGKTLTYDGILNKTMIWQSLYSDRSNVPLDLKRDCFRFGYTIVNSKFFTSKPDWEYNPATWCNLSENITNKELLQNIFALCRENDFDIYIRDVSFLNFPAYHIVVPQMSFTINKKSVIYYQNCLDNENFFNNKNDKHIKNLNTIKNFPCNKNLVHYYMLPVYFHKKDFTQVNNLLRQILNDDSLEQYFDLKVLKCLYDYVNMVQDKIDEVEIKNVLNLLYKENVFIKFENEWLKTDNPVKHWKVPKVDLKYAENSEKVFNKLLKCYMKNMPEQKNISNINHSKSIALKV